MNAVDPRGVLRTVASVEASPSAYLVRFVGCEHVGRTNRTMVVRAGEMVRCFACGQDARVAELVAGGEEHVARKRLGDVAVDAWFRGQGWDPDAGREET